MEKEALLQKVGLEAKHLTTPLGALLGWLLVRRMLPGAGTGAQVTGAGIGGTLGYLGGDAYSRHKLDTLGDPGSHGSQIDTKLSQKDPSVAFQPSTIKQYQADHGKSTFFPETKASQGLASRQMDLKLKAVMEKIKAGDKAGARSLMDQVKSSKALRDENSGLSGVFNAALGYLK
jgi:hypothetical protein